MTVNLSAHAIALAINDAGGSPMQIDVFQTIESTNTWLLKQATPMNQARLCVAESQTAGRGRRGNQWQSGENKNITMSLAWRFARWPRQITGLSLAIGMLVAENLNSTYGLNVKVKWPNDLMVGDEKLGGILIELSGEPNQACMVVIGLGLNVNQRQPDAASADYRWVDLTTLGVQPDRNLMVGTLAHEMVQTLRAFAQFGFKPLLTAWPEYSNYNKRRILVYENYKLVTSGEMIGVDEMGALLVRDDLGSTHIFSDSSVSVRFDDREST